MHEYVDFSLFPDVYIKNLPRPNFEKHIKLVNNKAYIVKFPDELLYVKNRTDNGKYSSISRRNTALAEYIGSHIFQILGFETQNTIIGKDIREDGKTKEVVGCESFLEPDENLMSFFDLIASNPEQGHPHDTRLNSIMNQIDLFCPDPENVKKQFFRMIIVDAFIQNYDRNNRNWGFIEKNGILRLAPIYDCGSSLFAAISDRKKLSCLREPNSNESKYIFGVGISALKLSKNQRCNYSDLLLNKDHINSDNIPFMWKAFRDIVPLINARMPSIYKMIDEIPLDNRVGGKGQLQKDFYKLALRMRKELVLDRAVKELYLDDKIKLWTQEIKEQDRKKARQERERLSPQKTIIPEIKIQIKGKSRFD